VQRGVEREFRLAVDAGHEGAPFVVHRHVHPGAPARQQLVQAGGAQVDGKHLPAHEVPPDAGGT